MKYDCDHCDHCNRYNNVKNQQIYEDFHNNTCKNTCKNKIKSIDIQNIHELFWMIYNIGDKDECSIKCISIRIAAIVNSHKYNITGDEYEYPGYIDNPLLNKIVDDTFNYLTSLYQKYKEDFIRFIPEEFSYYIIDELYTVHI